MRNTTADTVFGGKSKGKEEVESEAWYAVWTRSRHEYTVEKNLQRKGLRTFLPTVPHLSRRTDRRKILDCPLFPGYLFLRVASIPERRLLVLQTPGVVTILGEDPLVSTPIPDKQVEAIQKLLDSGLAFATLPYLHIGERVQIKDGPLSGVEGVIQEYRGKSRMVVSVDLLQRSVAVEIEGWRLERA